MSIWENLKLKFISCFITDNRYLYFLEGLRATLIITFLAVVLGVVLGFALAYIRTTHDRTGRLKFLNVIARVYLTVIRGTPTMIQLLIMNFVILVSCNNPYLIASLAFGMNSAAYVAEIFRSGIMSIDPGQMEAARSLGLSYTQATWKVIMPQAIKNVLPALGNEIIVLLKETSISGYIGLMDLTRGGDIIRSTTYEAFLPLIAVALIYLVIVMVLSAGVSKLERRLRNNERK